MKQFNILFLILFCFTCSQLQSQVRYLDESFSTVSVAADITYATNISVLTGAPVAQDLLMDVYTPDGDDATDRPVVIFLHTGSFLPQYLNGQVTGGKSDSTVVEICTRLAKLGYVAIAATYRAGWNPAALGADGQDIRTGTLLNAAYRGIQDFRACIRYLRKSVAENDNPYGIDPDKIGGWGQGTGGYITMGAAYLDRFEEVVLPKFLSAELVPYVDTSLSGGVYGLEQRPLNVANHVGYSSDFSLCINMGGALGDASWVEGSDDEPVNLGFHVATDPFAPFGNGPVIVPTTGDFVVNVSGTRTTVDSANTKGSNDALAPANDLANILNATNQALQPIPFQFPGQEATTLATDNMYPLLTPGNRVEAGPWDWWGKPQLDATIDFINMTFGTSYDSDALHNDGLLTNPDMSAEKGRAYIDTLMAYTIPRACIALELGDCLNALGIVDVQEVLTDGDVGLTLAPNPASEQIFLQSNADSPMEEIRIFDVRGLMVRSDLNVNGNSYTLQRSNLPTGIYVARIRFEGGIISKKIVFK